jgi:tRNA dimethylallyltransferase
MMEAGWVDEVRVLIEAGVPSDAQSMQAIGYRHLREYLDDERDLEETIRLIKRDTRRFAKRQLTWLRGGAEYRWLSPANADQRRACTAMMITRANLMWG